MSARDWATVDYYARLGVAPTATGEEIGVAFRALAKQLHPDRVEASEAEAERFKSITAAYDVLGDERLRHSYDAVRVDATGPPSRAAGPVATMTRVATATTTTQPAPLSGEALRRRARRWIAGGIAVTIAGLVAAALIVHLQVGERNRREGRIKTTAVVLVTPTGHQVRFVTAAGDAVEATEPERVNPGTQQTGDTVEILYRADRPTDVLLVESTAARDITLWFVAVKLLVGGTVFLAVGFRRLRQARAATSAA